MPKVSILLNCYVLSVMVYLFNHRVKNLVTLGMIGVSQQQQVQSQLQLLLWYFLCSKENERKDIKTLGLPLLSLYFINLCQRYILDNTSLVTVEKAIYNYLHAHAFPIALCTKSCCWINSIPLMFFLCRIYIFHSGTVILDYYSYTSQGRMFSPTERLSQQVRFLCSPLITYTYSTFVCKKGKHQLIAGLMDMHKF